MFTDLIVMAIYVHGLRTLKTVKDACIDCGNFNVVRSMGDKYYKIII